MKSELFTDFDMSYVDPHATRDIVRDGTWVRYFNHLKTTMPEFPFHVRRERFHGTSGYIHRHSDFFALYIVRAGRGRRYINGHTCSLARGDIFLMAATSCHSWRDPVDLTIDAIYFHQSLWDARTWNILLQLPDLASYLNPEPLSLEARGFTDHFGHLSPEPHSRIEAVFKEVRREFNSMKLPQRISARARVLTLLIQLAEWRENKTFTTRPAKGAGIAELLNFCESNFHQPISNAQLAELMHFSEGHFREVFLREVGISPGAYLRHLRLQHSQKLLANNKLPIADIARLSGFASATHFGQVFKGTFGMPPKEFRKRQGVSKMD